MAYGMAHDGCPHGTPRISANWTKSNAFTGACWCSDAFRVPHTILDKLKCWFHSWTCIADSGHNKSNIWHSSQHKKPTGSNKLTAVDKEVGYLFGYRSQCWWAQVRGSGFRPSFWCVIIFVERDSGRRPRTHRGWSRCQGFEGRTAEEYFDTGHHAWCGCAW